MVDATLPLEQCRVITPQIYDLWNLLAVADAALHLEEPISGDHVTDCPAATIVKVARCALDQILSDLTGTFVRLKVKSAA